MTEAATALDAIDVLFRVCVIVQFRYFFGGNARRRRNTVIKSSVEARYRKGNS